MISLLGPGQPTLPKTCWKRKSFATFTNCMTEQGTMRSDIRIPKYIYLHWKDPDSQESWVNLNKGQNEEISSLSQCTLEFIGEQGNSMISCTTVIHGFNSTLNYAQKLTNRQHISFITLTNILLSWPLTFDRCGLPPLTNNLVHFKWY